MKDLINKLKQTEHGFTHIIKAGDELLADALNNHLDTVMTLLKDESYQARMLAAYLLGQLSINNKEAFTVLSTKVAKDNNWRVQEMLAKAFDYHCAQIGYEKALPVIKKWLADKNPNVVRAVIEGLRVWTARPYFKDNAAIAITLISEHKDDESDYVRRSAGNALRDIRKKHRASVDKELEKWNLADKNTAFTHKLVVK
jgi:3-methyladenine DNA glycosylase AlkD